MNIRERSMHPSVNARPAMSDMALMLFSQKSGVSAERMAAASARCLPAMSLKNR